MINLKKKDIQKLTEFKNQQRQEQKRIRKNIKEQFPTHQAILNQQDNVIKNLKRKRAQLKYIMQDLLMDKMENNPELVLKLQKPRQMKLLVQGVSKKCICKEYINFENNRFFLYVSEDGINTEFLIEKNRANKNKSKKEISMKG